MTQRDPKKERRTFCRFYDGSKPCGKNDVCSVECSHFDLAQPRILIIHLEALGAVLRATAILPAVKRQWPKAHITWVTSPLASALLENNPFIDRILKNNHDGVLALSSLSFDYTFSIDKSLTAAGLLRVPVSIGECRGFGVETATGAIIPLNPEAQELYDLGLDNHQKFFVNKKTEIQLITESLALPYKRDPYVFKFSAEEKKLRKELAMQLKADSKLVIGLNTGCSGMIPYKKLTVDGWLRLLEDIAPPLNTAFQKQVSFMLLGGPEDTQRNLEIAQRSQVPVVLTPTEEGLRKGLIYTDLCDVIVTGDSLGMHMGIALKKWVVAWFGPTCSHEIEFYDRGMAVHADVGCGPCWRRLCKNTVMCHDRVSSTKVLNAINSFTNQGLHLKMNEWNQQIFQTQTLYQAL